jgi:hypothetical protein
MTERLWLTQITLWSIEVAPFLALSGLDTPTSPSSPFQSLYRSENGDDVEEGSNQPAKGKCTPTPRKPPQRTVMSVITVMVARKTLV